MAELAPGALACAVCGLSFDTRNRLFRHLRDVHEGVERGPIAEPPSVVLDAQKPAAPEVHAKAASQSGKKTKADKQSQPSKPLQIEVRPTTYQAELDAKVVALRSLLDGCGALPLPPTEVAASPPEHFRMKVDFDITWIDGERKGAPLPRFAMNHGNEKKVVESYPMGARVICDKLMPRVQRILEREEVLRKQLFQITFHTTLHGDAMVSLLYRTPYVRAQRRLQAEPISRDGVEATMWRVVKPTDPRIVRIRISKELRSKGIGALQHAKTFRAIDRDEWVELVDEPGFAPKALDGITVLEPVEETAAAEASCPLTNEWETAAQALSDELDGASIIGRIRGQKRVVGRDWAEERLTVAGVPQQMRYRQLAGFFSQSNPWVASQMLAWARAVAFSDDTPIGFVQPAEPRGDDLLELYCGNGNFSIALASLFRKVLATELVRDLMEVAPINAEANLETNVSFARVSAEELAMAIDGHRKFERLQHVDFDSYELNTVLVDPPRVGLGPTVSEFLVRFRRIVYISCNPVTLRSDLDILCKTHDIKRLAAFDQFPYTDHLEMGVLLVLRPSGRGERVLPSTGYPRQCPGGL